MRRKWTSQKGTAAVEFALVLVPLVLLVFGAIEFGALLYNKQVITNASREGARAGIVATGTQRVLFTGTNSIENIVKDSAKTVFTFKPPTTNDLSVRFLDPTAYKADPLTNTTATYNPNALFGTDLVVQARYQYSFLVIPSFVPSILGLYKTINGVNGYTISATTVMKYE
jgi:Flp pilus assembly protein TadG